MPSRESHDSSKDRGEQRSVRASRLRLLTVVVSVGVVVTAATALTQSWGMMGGGTMGGAAGDQPVAAGWGGGVMNYAQARAFIRYGDAHGHADAKANTVSFEGDEVTIDMVAVQPGSPDQTFEVHELVNPTLVVPRGSTVHLNLVNMDYGRSMEHTIEIVTTPPPYPTMAMMSLGTPVVQPLPEVPWRSQDDAKLASYGNLDLTFVADKPGTYWYVCPTPEHAEKGMYGKMIVR